MPLTRIGSIGINTGIKFSGLTTITTLNTSIDALSIGGPVSIAGTLTYEDVTNIDSVGLVTARNGIVVGSGITLSKDGDVFFTGIATGNGSGLTALNATQLTSGTVPTARLGSGTASSSTFLRGDSSFQTVNTDLVSDTSPQLGGDLASNGNDIVIADNDKIKVGTGGDLHIFHNGSQSKITDTIGNELRIQADTIRFRDKDDTDTYANFIHDGAVELYYDNTKMFETRSGASAFVNGDLILDSDSHKLKLGLGADLNIYHNGSHSFIDNDTGTLYLQTATNISFMTNNNEDAILCAANGAVSLYHDNTLQCSTAANGLAFPNGKGIDFSADGNTGGMTSELLDDYEEGTFTPTSTATLTESGGSYTKIGRQVTVHIRVVFASQSSSTNMQIENLPFTAAMQGGVSNGAMAGGFGYISGGSVIPQIHDDGDDNDLRFYNFATPMTISNVSGKEYRFGFVYHTAT